MGCMSVNEKALRSTWAVAGEMFDRSQGKYTGDDSHSGGDWILKACAVLSDIIVYPCRWKLYYASLHNSWLEKYIVVQIPLRMSLEMMPVHQGIESIPAATAISRTILHSDFRLIICEMLRHEQRLTTRVRAKEPSKSNLAAPG